MNATWLRASFWAGAITDALVAVLMLAPELFAKVYGLDGFRPSMEFRLAMGMAASLMTGWTALLLWADRKPAERRDILVLTVVPVIAGLVAVEIVAVATGFIAAGKMAPTWILQGALSTLFLVSWWRSRT